MSDSPDYRAKVIFEMDSHTYVCLIIDDNKSTKIISETFVYDKNTRRPSWASIPSHKDRECIMKEIMTEYIKTYIRDKLCL